MKIIIYHSLFVLMLTLAVGCGNNCTVSGKVTFPDGTPLDRGTVMFEDGKLAASGYIAKDGTYSLITGDQNGIPRGTYQVSIGGLTQPTVTTIPPANGKGPPKVKVTPSVSPIDSKYHASATSGLTCEVKGRTKYDITVEPPTAAKTK